MKIVADENIPLVDYYFGSLGEVIAKPGRDIVRDDLLAADILLVRSVTQVNQALLHDTPVKFVGSTTIGEDHLDTVWLNEAGIRWSVATGCNSTAVVEYVVAVVAALQKKDVLSKTKKLRAAVMGVGRIGSQVAKMLSVLGFEVVLCDPYRTAKEKDFQGVFIEDLTDLDLITLHTPLTYEGTYPTYHLIEREFLQRQKPGCILINTGRGAAVDFVDLKDYGKELVWCLDVWENEPTIDLDVLQHAFIATPHIAGYSVQSKYRGIKIIYQAAIQQGIISDSALQSVPYPQHSIALHEPELNWRDVVLKIYDPLKTTVQMKQDITLTKNTFDLMRKHFPSRHEFHFVACDVGLSSEDKAILKLLFNESDCA